MNIFKLLTAIAVLLATTSANATLIKTSDLKKYCGYEKAPRQTIIYLDQSVIAKNDLDWFKDIINKLDYLPSERVSINMINRETSRAEDLFSGCYPKVSPARFKKMKADTNIFQTNPEKILAEDKKMFKKFIYKSFEVPMRTSGLEERPTYKVGTFPKKSIAEAIYYDSSRFELKNGASRVIIFSDMVENRGKNTPSSITEKTVKAHARALAKRYPVNLNNAEFLAYGIGSTYRDSNLTRNLETFWKYYFNHSQAYLKSYGQQLPTRTPAIPQLAVSYAGVMDLDGRKVAASLRLTIPRGKSSGKLINGFYGMNDILYPLKGTFSCKSKSKCNIEAEIIFGNEDDHAFKSGDVLRVGGKLSALFGTIGAKDEVETLRDGTPFLYKLSFVKDDSLQF